MNENLIENPPDNNRDKEGDIYLRSNFISKLFFLWTFRVIKTANKKQLVESDLGHVEGKNQSKAKFDSINYFWEFRQYKEKRFPIIKSLFRSNILIISIIQILSIIQAVSHIFSIILFRSYINSFDGRVNLSKIISTGVLYILLKLLVIFLDTQVHYQEQMLVNKIEIQLNSLLFQKILKESPSSSKFKVTQGQKINYFNRDSSRVSGCMIYSHYFLNIPLKIIIYIYLLFTYFGYIFIYSICSMIFFMLINLIFQKKIFFYENLKMKKGDNRMKLTTEVINHIKMIKLYALEDEMKKRILQLRKEEINVFWKTGLFLTPMIVIFYAVPVFVTGISFGVYQYLNHNLTVTNILTMFTIFNDLNDCVIWLPVMIQMFLEAYVSVKRLEKFFSQDEIKPDSVYESSDFENAIKIENGNFSWGSEEIEKDDEKGKDKDSKKKKSVDNKGEDEEKSEFNKSNIHVQDLDISSISDSGSLRNGVSKSMISLESIQTGNDELISNGMKKVLSDINLTIKKGELVMIVGEIGSGKTSLFYAIMNSLNQLDQKSYLEVNGSLSFVNQTPWIQNNTVKDNILFNQEFKKEKYNQIIQICELKEDIELLVGGDMTEIGEKGINLSGGQKARIALARAAYSESDIYLFDDPLSALDAHVGQKIFFNLVNEYLQNKTRLLITHSVQYLQHSNRIIYMKNGKIYWEGSYSELLMNSEMFKTICESIESKTVKNENLNNTVIDNKNTDDANESKISRITQDEDYESGKVNMAVYKRFLKENGYLIMIGISICLICMISLINASDVVVTYWTKTKASAKNWDYYWYFIGLGLGSLIFVFFRNLLQNLSSCRLSERIHQIMIEKLISAPINTYHETVKKGQILNRLSKDLSQIDEAAMWSFVMILFNFYSVIGSLIMCFIFLPYSIILAPFLAIVCYFLVKYYMNSGRDLTRLNKMASTPILNIISETVSGVSTIKASKFEEKQFQKFLRACDSYSKINQFLNGTNQWLSFYLNLLSVVFIIFLIIFTIVFRSSYNSQIVGLLLTFSTLMQESVFSLFSEFADLEKNMISMERCLKFLEIPQEKPYSLETDKELINWPEEGKIQFNNFSVRYREDSPIILKNLTFSIKSKEKIGVVGRTGSGKSTLCLSLFRILESSNGIISIDGIDISKIGLKTLRKSMSIIPQDVLLVEGSLRYNIDPVSEYSEADIQEAVKLSGLDSFVNSNSKGLDQMIAENGSNMSVGEKQLISICKAILRKSKIIVMDEATANIDIKTEELIQKSLNVVLKNATIITIAHRIKTILNYDRILTLEQGEIREFDTPENLLKNQNSLFYDLYMKSNL